MKSGRLDRFCSNAPQDKTISLDGDDRAAGDKAAAAVERTAIQLAGDHKTSGNAAFKNAKYDEAIVHYDRAIEVCPPENNIDLSTFYQNRAAAYEQLRKWKAVREDCSRALELNPRYVKALHRRARANECLNEFFASLEDITATCILESFQNNSSLTFADRILKHIGATDAEEAMRTRTPVMPSACFIRTYLSSFSTDPVRRVKLPPQSNGTTTVEPAPAESGFVRARRALDAERYEDIIPACTEEIESSESEAAYKTEALLLRGTFHLLCGQQMEALIDLEQVARNADAPRAYRVNAHVKMASLMVQNKNLESGLKHFAEAEQLDDANPDVYHQRGQVYVLTERLPDAVAEFTRAFQLDGTQGMTYIQKCYAEYRLAFVQQNQAALIVAMSSFQEAVQRFPKCVECYSVMAQVLTEQQQFEQADHFFRKALEVGPQVASIYVHHGIMQLQWNGDIEKALEYIRRAIEVDEKCEFGLETLGTIEVQRGNLENAVELFGRAIRLAKTEAELQHLYALKNAAVAQINVAKNLGIDMASLSAMAQTAGMS